MSALSAKGRVAADGVNFEEIAVRPKRSTAELSPNFGDGVKDQAAAWA